MVPKARLELVHPEILVRELAIDSFGSEMGDDYIYGSALLGTDLSNHHPVSVLYDTALSTTDDNLKDPATTVYEGGTISKKTAV